MPHTPRYRIQAVAAATGLTDATLRAWERRYKLPQPARAPNGYRLYSDHDLGLVRRMQQLIEKGHAPADAARLARSVSAAETAGPADVARDVVAQAMRAGLDYDADAMNAALDRARQVGPAWRVFTDVVIPTMRAVGDGWSDDRVTVGHEHFISEAFASMLRGLLRLMDPPMAARTLLLACVEEEQHVLPLYGVALFAAHAGWRPIVLGARTPPPALASAVRTLNPDAVALSATMRFDGDFAAYADLLQGRAWIAGGPGLSRHEAVITACGGVLAPEVPAITAFLRGVEA